MIYPGDLQRAYGNSGLWTLYSVYVAENKVAEKAPFISWKIS